MHRQKRQKKESKMVRSRLTVSKASTRAGTGPPSLRAATAASGSRKSWGVNLKQGHGERRSSADALCRFKMMARLSQILNPAMENKNNVNTPTLKPGSKLARLRLICRVRTVLGRKIASTTSVPTGKLDVPTGKFDVPTGKFDAPTGKFDKKNSVYWKRFVKKPTEPKLVKWSTETETAKVDPVVEIHLSTISKSQHDEVSYDIKSRSYTVVRKGKDLFDFLTLPSRILHVNDPRLRKEETPTPEDKEEEEEKMTQLLEELYGDVMSKEEIATIDSQPNPFNFSERVSQTPWCNKKESGIQTEPPPGTTFSQSIGFAEIYDTYNWDHHLSSLREKEKRKEKERSSKLVTPLMVTMPLSLSDESLAVLDSPRSSTPKKTPSPFENIPGLHKAATIVERMIAQNIFDDIAQDFKYWEDGSDEFKPHVGSLLPLWRFTNEKGRTLTVTDVSWSPTYPDLFAAAYISEGVGEKGGPGMLCLYSLKNPATPERTFSAPCGVTCVNFHPQHSNLVLAGWSDGTVVVYDAKSSSTPKAIRSNPVTGKHILPVSQVRWVSTEPSEGLRFFSVALDGRVTKWQLSSRLEAADVLLFDTMEDKTYCLSSAITEEIHLQGRGTCLAFCPSDNRLMLVGVDTGEVIQCCTTSPSNSLTRYSAHQAPVRDLAWNKYQQNLFLSCSSDWTIKIWLQLHLTPLIVLDMGGAIAGVSWVSYSSSVLIAATEEGRVHVYDLFICKAPLCSQNIVKRRRLRMSCLSFNKWFPVVLIGGEKGHLVTLKLSPNLRQKHKDPRDYEGASPHQIEVCKIDRLISVNG